MVAESSSGDNRGCFDVDVLEFFSIVDGGVGAGAKYRPMAWTGGDGGVAAGRAWVLSSNVSGGGVDSCGTEDQVMNKRVSEAGAEWFGRLCRVLIACLAR
jgi:hypothetical protein